MVSFLDNFSLIQYCHKTGSYKGPEMVAVTEEVEDLIQRFSAVSLLDCGECLTSFFCCLKAPDKALFPTEKHWAQLFKTLLA